MSFAYSEFGWKDAEPTCAHDYILPAVQKSALCRPWPIPLAMEVDNDGG